MSKKLIASLGIAGILVVGGGIAALVNHNTSDDDAATKTVAYDKIEDSTVDEINEETDLIAVEDEGAKGDKDVKEDINKDLEQIVESIDSTENDVPAGVSIPTIEPPKTDKSQTDGTKSNNNTTNTDTSKANETAKDKTNGQVNTVKKYDKNTIYFLDKKIPYENGGKEKGTSIIEDDKTASTWGGTTKFSGTDNKNTHFIGDNNHQFKNIEKATEFVITDANAKAFKYVVKTKVTVDEYGIGFSGEMYS